MPIIFPHQELIIAAVAAIFLLVVVLPRLWSFLELSFLKKFNAEKLGNISYTPVPIFSKKPFRDAVTAAQRAMTSHHSRFRYRIKVITVPDPIEEAVRVEATTDIPLGRLSPFQSNYQKGPPKTSLRMVVRVDIIKQGDRIKATWRYVPEDPSLFQSQLQVQDPNVDYLLEKTNFALIKHLGPLA